MAADTDKQSFWEHLDVLRAAIVKSLLVAVVFGVAAFCFKEELFAVILAPKDADFITYRLLYSLGGLVTESGAPDFLVKLINTGLAGQFIIHMKAALCAGVLCASPYILYQLFRFVSPALYVNERKYVVQVVGGGYAMFALGVAVSYFLIFPLTFRFLGTYQVCGEVENMIALQSYISTLMTMSLAMGLFLRYQFYRGCSPNWDSCRPILCANTANTPSWLFLWWQLLLRRLQMYLRFRS